MKALSITQKILFPLAILFLCFSCEDVVDVELEPGNNQLVIDAWINNQAKAQTIRLIRTSPYFDSNASPVERGATVIITDDSGTVFPFLDENGDGSYNWEPAAGESFGRVGGIYTLSITTSDNKEYTAVSEMKRIMAIDSITYDLEEEDQLGQPAGIYAEFFARDFPGEGDTYWIKAYKNGQYLNKPQEMNLAYDASFTPGGNADGIYLITPIRFGINRVADSGDDAVDTNDFPPYDFGDSLHVEIHSITEDAYFFLSAARTQMTLGDATLFAEPPANVPTNIIPLNATEPRDQAVGFFNVAAVSELGRRF